MSPHTKVCDAVHNELKSQRPIFENYLEIAHHVEDMACPGVLVLVVAGFAGKVFLEYARKSGAVALDIGAMADYFANYKTRTVCDLV